MQPMEHVKRQEAEGIQKTLGCVVHEYITKHAAINMAVVDIQGRYPDAGCVINHACTEMGYVVKGTGWLVTESHTAPLAEGDVILIPQGEKYHWEGRLTVVLAVAPAWYPAQHEHLPQLDLRSALGV